ncbi:MAG: aminoacylase [Candidatus Glassbacteria bacterium RIFCSPLOWO2_12_FULL_58_11]|uniref:Aminoacylase n=1 Tax=Candidatus Glassbacteria bacterium RIFCSPLOWO2_12_FULL_58_11 TaxID=1817867 RepID=A0A1F5YLI5_9BACT|nr:MAG: aminoacylase [Candidatus Glassbacteria bacterium RIFCSPLOWO2_12_FULL_58_11]
MSTLLKSAVALIALSIPFGCSPAVEYDTIIRNGMIYDGSGSAPYSGDLAISGDSIAALGKLPGNARGRGEIDAHGLAVCPGFINMLSWANESLIADGRSQSDIRQGVTLEVLGEGESMGPLSDKMKQELLDRQSDIKYAIEWNTLGEYLEYMEKRGISTNLASFIGAATPRINVIGYENRPPTLEELDRMRALVRQSMLEGAMGVASSLIYAPSFYAGTEELIALAQEAGKYGGMYISHMRSEGNGFLEALDELLTIARRAGVRAEIYHFKAAGEANWPKLEEAIRKIEAARTEGLQITADIYPYTAAATGLDAAMPPWVQEGGFDAWAARLQDPAIRKKVSAEMGQPGKNWENFFSLAGPENMLLIKFKNDSLKSYTGKTLAEVAALRGTPAAETAMDLVYQDGSRLETVYFLMSEENVRRKVALPWVSVGSDMESSAPEGVFLESSTHPRAYGSFARFIGKYAREEGLIPIQEAVHRLSGLPASNLRLARRGLLKPGYFADVVVFDPQTIIDHATFENPKQYATGVAHVFVNGGQVIKDGEHTGAKPGRIVRGPGYKGAAGM